MCSNCLIFNELYVFQVLYVFAMLLWTKGLVIFLIGFLNILCFVVIYINTWAGGCGRYVLIGRRSGADKGADKGG
jgi:hypothetical protein